ncbi:hypothetical protein JCM17380_21820 [Desulfosporosinus burensis]
MSLQVLIKTTNNKGYFCQKLQTAKVQSGTMEILGFKGLCMSNALGLLFSDHQVHFHYQIIYLSKNIF